MVCYPLFAVTVAALALWSAPHCQAISTIGKGSEDPLALRSGAEFPQISSDLPGTSSDLPGAGETAQNQGQAGRFLNLLQNPSLLSRTPVDPEPAVKRSAADGAQPGATGSAGDADWAWVYQEPRVSGLLTDCIPEPAVSRQGVFGVEDTSDIAQRFLGPSSPPASEGETNSVDGAAPEDQPLGLGSLLRNTGMLFFPRVQRLSLKDLDKTVQFN
jgi:hypothetical protein